MHKSYSFIHVINVFTGLDSGFGCIGLFNYLLKYYCFNYSSHRNTKLDINFIQVTVLVTYIISIPLRQILHYLMSLKG
jgi:hypothetical protein